MSFKEYKALIRRFGGTVEDLGGGEYVARFPTVWHKEQFEKACSH
jgi:hypothetical protein